MSETIDIKFKRPVQEELVEAPLHACEYCQQHDVNSVVNCTQCKRWFCNTPTQSGSHIILHLIKNGHKSVCLHPKNENEVSALECYFCETNNLFLLGQVNATYKDKEHILIICRSCQSASQNQEITWKQNDFQSLVQEKCIQPWLAKQHNETKPNRVTIEKIHYYEERKLKDPALRFEDVERRTAQVLKDVQLRYQDARHYQETFAPLVRLEEEQDKQMKEGQTQNGISVRWDVSLKKKRQAFFTYAGREEFDTNQLQGTEMLLSHKNSGWQSKGTVVKIQNEEVCLELHSNETPPLIETGYTFECIWVSTTFKRMQSGLKRFVREETSISNYLYRMIMGRVDSHPPDTLIQQLPQKLSAPNLPELNHYQVEAVKKALKQPLSLIQGPPGTGKTVTSATIVHQLVKCFEKQKQREQVLVCAPSNIVVDQLAEKIHKTGVKVVRLCSKTRESVSSNVEFLTLHNQVRSLDLPQYEKLQNLFELQEEQGELNGKDETVFIRLRDEAEKDIIQQADVICTTCIGSADKRLKGLRFIYVLIDEATQAIEPECILPMLKGAKHVILVGDHRQLGPVVQSRAAVKAGLDHSLFERFVNLGIRPVRLQVQYRMHPELTVFPSNTFYEGTLQNGVTVSDRLQPENFPWPNKHKPMVFIDVNGQEQISASGTSYINQFEAVLVEQSVLFLVQSGVRPSQIGIITPYKGQRCHIISYLLKNGNLLASQYREIEVASVDGFQGREKDFIIISCVRSNQTGGIGFLTNPRRLNVTITRARFGLIVIGNARVLSKDQLWNNMLNHFKDQDLLMEGNWPHLKPCMLKFKAPQKFVTERRDNTMNQDTGQDDILNNFQYESGQAPMTKGLRESQMGYTVIPDVGPFQGSSSVARPNRPIDAFDLKDVYQMTSLVEKIGEFKRENVDI